MAQLKDTRIYGNLIVDTLLTTKKIIISDTIETLDFVIKNNSLNGNGNISVKLINNSDEANYWSIDTNKTTKNIDFVFNVSDTDKAKKISIDNNGDLYIKDGTKKVWHTGTFNPDSYFPLSGNKIVTGNLIMGGTATIVIPNNVGYTVVSSAGSYLSAIKLDSTNVLSIGENNRANIKLDASIVYTDGEVRAATFKGALVGNANTATKLKTPVKIGATNFDGSSPITLDQMKAYSATFRKSITTKAELDAAVDTGYYWVKGLSINGLYSYGILFVNRDDTLISQIYTSHWGETAVRQSWGYSSSTPGFSQWYNSALTTGNVASATKLQIPRLINYVEFDGTKDIQFGKLISGANFTNSNFKTIVFGTINAVHGFETVRWTTVIPSVLSGLGHGQHGNMFVFAGGDNHGFLALDYGNNIASVGGGNADKIIWTENLAFKNNSFFSYSLETIGGTVTDYSSFNKTGIYRVTNNTLGGRSHAYGQLINFRYDTANPGWRTQIYIPDSGNSKEGIILVRNAYDGTSVESRAWHQIPVLNGYTNLMNVKGFMRVGGLNTHNEANIIMDITGTVAGIGSSGTSNIIQYGKVISVQNPSWNTVQDLTHNFMGRMTIYGNTQSDPCLLTLRGTTVAQNKEASIKFISDSDPGQAVLLKYNTYDAIRAPFGLNVVSENSASGKAYLDVEGVIYAGDRICVNNRIDAKGQYGSWEEQAPANCGFSVNDGFGGPLYVDVTAGGKAIKGYGMYTAQHDLGYASYSWLGHLREGHSSLWGSTVLYFDPEGRHGKFWRFNHDTGDFVSPGNVIAYSDIKLKKDLEVIPNPIDKILSLTGYNYTRRDTNERQTGLIAQEVQKVMPEAVSQYADMNGETTLGVSYGNLVGLLVEGIKELKLEVDRLKHALGEVK